MSSNQKVKELLISKLSSWDELDGQNIFEVTAIDSQISLQVVEDLGKELIVELKQKAEILADLTTHGEKIDSSNV